MKIEELFFKTDELFFKLDELFLKIEELFLETDELFSFICFLEWRTRRTFSSERTKHKFFLSEKPKRTFFYWERTKRTKHKQARAGERFVGCLVMGWSIPGAV